MSAEDFTSQVIIVTGAASGIGQRTVERLRAAGASVVALDRSPINAATAQASLFDVTQEEQWQAIVAETLGHYGRIDGLVNCAGIIVMGAVVDTTLDDFRRVMGVNVEGTFLGMKHVLPPMLTAGRGSIVNISSAAGIAAAPGAGAYCASKGAVRMLTKSAALDALAAGTKVRVNSVHPAMTDTPMVTEIVRQLGDDPEIKEQMRQLQPSGGFVTPDAVVDAILFLLSDRSQFINATELLVDNGFTAQ